MRKQTRRMMGLTIGQLTVLACMGLATLGVMGLTGWFVLINPDPFHLQAAPAAAPLELPSAVPLPTETPLPTRTPLLPSPTFTPTTYASLIPSGWKQYTYQTVEFWAPPEFVTQTGGESLIELVDKKPGDLSFSTEIGLDSQTDVTMDLNAYVSESLGHLPADMTFLEKKDFQIGEYTATRMKLQVIISDVSVLEALYWIKVDSTIWEITCATFHDDFHDELPVFDQVARTFRIQP